MTEQIDWMATCTELPDEQVTVLLFSKDAGGEPVWLGYLDELTAHGYVWRSVDGTYIDNVTHWAEMPCGPRSKI